MITDTEVQQVPPADSTADSSQPLVPSSHTHNKKSTSVYNVSNGKVPAKSTYPQTFFYAVFALLTVAASGAGLWYVMDPNILLSPAHIQQTEQADVQAEQPGHALSSLPPIQSPTSTSQLVISETTPLDKCMGDCDDDSDCAAGLRCFKRNGNTAVPGCFGGLEDNRNTDYCIPIELPSLVETNTFPLGLCEGDCDSNEDCQDGLVCYQRSEFEHVPGCSGGLEDGSGTDYCAPPSLAPQTYLMSLQQTLVGNPNEKFGFSVSLSQSDPLLMAVGAKDRGSTGYVNIYQLSEDDDWILVLTIDGDEIGSDFGHAVSLSWDGKYVAVGMPRSSISVETGKGAVRVFELTELSTTDISQSKFQQIGDDIRDDRDEYGALGYIVSLSKDGQILAVSRGESSSMFERADSGNWIPLGSTLEFGGPVTLSGDGSRVAFTSRAYYDGPDDVSDNGCGRVYELNGNKEWVQVGQALGDLPFSDSFGVMSDSQQTSSTLSGDGTIVVISSKKSVNSNVRIYKDNGDASWVAMGDPIVIPVGEHAKPSRVEISKDGAMLAIGDFSMGRVRLYEFETRTGQWVIVDEIHGANEDDKFGVNLSLASSKGEAYLAVGAPNTSQRVGINPGYAVTYKAAFGIPP